MGEYRSSANEEDVSLLVPLEGAGGMRRSGKHPMQCTHPGMRKVFSKSMPNLDQMKIPPPRFVRQGVSSLLPRDLSMEQVASLCSQAVGKELGKLPHNDTELRMARCRPPKNRTDALLKSGMPLGQVVRIVALRLLEQWVRILRGHVPKRSMVSTLSDILYALDGPSRLARSMSTMDLTGGFDQSGRLVLNPSPAPPASTPLGAALRRLVPRQGRCEYVDDIMAALDLEDEFVDTSGFGTSPSHILRPNTAVRCELDFQDLQETYLDDRMKPDCLKRKDLCDQARLSDEIIPHRCALGTASVLRLSGDTGGWATFNQNSCSRVTAFSFCAQVASSEQSDMSTPGPGTYQRPVSVMRSSRTAIYPAVGKMRSVGAAVMTSTCERFADEFFAKS